MDAAFDRYAYLLELADDLPPYPDALRTEDHLVPGCADHVWLSVYGRRGRFYFSADSDNTFDKGILLLLRDLLHGVSLKDAANAHLDLMPALHLNAGPAARYQPGVQHIVETLQGEARRLCNPRAC